MTTNWPPGYRVPPDDVLQLFEAHPTPSILPSPDGRWVLLSDYEPYPSIVQLSRPVLTLAGLKIDTEISAAQRLFPFHGLALLESSTGKSHALRLPLGYHGEPIWSHDSSSFAFVREHERSLELWIGGVDQERLSRIPNVSLWDFLPSRITTGSSSALDTGFPITWSRDSASLLVATRIDRAPPFSGGLRGPRMDETFRGKGEMPTFQGLLRDETQEDLFQYYFTSQLLRVSLDGEHRPLGPPGMYLSIQESPDCSYLLVVRLVPPFSRRVPYNFFGRQLEIWDRDGELLSVVGKTPAADQLPRQGVPLGPRMPSWQAGRNRLTWVEALDGGDPVQPVPHRDRLMGLEAPYDENPVELFRTEHRLTKWNWFEDPDMIMYIEFDRSRRRRISWVKQLDSQDDPLRVFDVAAGDSYSDPGTPLTKRTATGETVLLRNHGRLYLLGAGGSDQGARQFLDSLDLETFKTERLFECRGGWYESFAGFVGDSFDSILIQSQSSNVPPNLFVVDLPTQARKQLTRFSDPHPEFTRVEPQVLRYERNDGVMLSGTLYLPSDARPGPLPLVISAYPLDYVDPVTAGQFRGSPDVFTRLMGTTPLWFLTQGYAVLMEASMPVVGDSETLNDTFVDQVLDSARAAIDAVAKVAAISKNKILVEGHSYGAFLVATLLAHSDLFAAGIARSGAYNRSLTPFGFQTERRTFWEAPHFYLRISPYTYANRIKTPLLFIHGEDDDNAGTWPIQSELMHRAIQGSGGTARLVTLPYEGHGTRARESCLHVIAEMLEWGNRYLGSKEDN